MKRAMDLSARQGRGEGAARALVRVWATGWILLRGEALFSGAVGAVMRSVVLRCATLRCGVA
jgi:hypothetical protein